jgi:redox-sensing transcriptional repressor
VELAMSDANDKPELPETPAVPKAVINRLSLYQRELQHLLRDGKETTSSSQLGGLLGFTDAQVRKDLAYFGHFGHPGIGYRCEELIVAIRGILGTNHIWPVAIIGIGNLGKALIGYKGFSQQGFLLVAAFDVDTSKVGTKVEDVPVYALDDLAKIVTEKGIRLGIITVPASAAQSVADKLVAAGVVGVVNFAPVTITLPEGISLVGVDLAIELEQITFSVVNKGESG